MPRSLRWCFAKRAGVRFVVPDGEKPWFFIGKNVTFDSVYPENIVIYNGTHITNGCKFLTHVLDTKNQDFSDIFWKEAHIVIGPDVFIGTNTIITNSVKIGRGAIIGAGSVLTKDVGDFEIWAGNPARFIKKRG